MHPRDEGLAWKVFLQSLDVASGELVNEARKESLCEKPINNHMVQILNDCHVCSRWGLHLGLRFLQTRVFGSGHGLHVCG